MKLLQFYEENGFTKTSQGIDLLESLYNIKSKQYDSGLTVFNYCQIKSPKTDPLVKEYRGVILDEDLNIVCRPFDRFFNLGECPELEENFKIERSVVYEKLDGSLIKVYFDGSSWQVATRGTAYAESENYTRDTFQTLILEAFRVKDLEEFNSRLQGTDIDKDCTLIFEFISPDNRVVTPYEKSEMVLLGARRNTGNDLFDLMPWFLQQLKVKNLNVRLPKMFSFENPEEMKEFVNSLEQLQEGVVALDIISRVRIKLKSDLYVQVHRLRGENALSPRRIIDLVLSNEHEEYLVYFPENRDKIQEYVKLFDEFTSEVLKTWEENKSTEDMKEFALKIKDSVYAHLLFGAKRKSQEPMQVFWDLHLKGKHRMFEAWILN